MSVKLSLEQLMQRLALGDEDAAEELLRDYEPEVRRFVRFRLSSPTIRRFVDSLDVTQSVFAKFFVELRRGQISLQNSQQLRGFLFTMARNKLFDKTRREHAAKRDARRLSAQDGAARDSLTDDAPTPSEQLANNELVEMIRRQLSEDDLYLVEQRFDGRAWDDLADELGSTPDAIRKRMTRAVDRAARELGVI